MIKFVTICNFFLLGQGIKTTKIGPSGESKYFSNLFKRAKKSCGWIEFSKLENGVSV